MFSHFRDQTYKNRYQNNVVIAIYKNCFLWYFFSPIREPMLPLTTHCSILPSVGLLVVGTYAEIYL